MFAVSLAFASVAFADVENGKKLFNSKAKKCKTCHKAQGSPDKFKPVGPGLKDVGKRHTREWLVKWLSPTNNEIWESKDAGIKDIMTRYSAAKKGKVMKKSQMVKNFGPRKGGKPPKIVLSDAERNDIIDFLMSL